MRQQYPMEDDFLVVGDLNAGQRYVRTVDWNMMATGIRNPMHFVWMVPDSADTTTALGEDQAHDRIIGTNTVQAQWTGTWEVMKSAFTLSEGLSDHYPIWASFAQSEL